MGGHALKMFRLTGKRGWSVCIIAYNGNIQAIRVSVYVTTFAIIPLEGVCRLERELFGKSYACHNLILNNLHVPGVGMPR